MGWGYYLHTHNKRWLVLFSISHGFTYKKIIGYAFDKNMTTDLIIRALDNALIVQKPDDGLIFHSNLGSQYTSSDFINYI